MRRDTNIKFFRNSPSITFLNDCALRETIENVKEPYRIVLIDVRDKEEFEMGHFPSNTRNNIEVKNIPWKRLKYQPADDNWRNNIVIYHCESGGRTQYFNDIMDAIIAHHQCQQQQLGMQSNPYVAAQGLQQLERVLGVNRIGTQEKSREFLYSYRAKL